MYLHSFSWPNHIKWCCCAKTQKRASKKRRMGGWWVLRNKERLLMISTELIRVLFIIYFLCDVVVLGCAKRTNYRRMFLAASEASKNKTEFNDFFVLYWRIGWLLCVELGRTKKNNSYKKRENIVKTKLLTIETSSTLLSSFGKVLAANTQFEIIFN